MVAIRYLNNALKYKNIDKKLFVNSFMGIKIVNKNNLLFNSFLI